MKSAVSFPPEYFLRYKQKPVKIKTFTKRQERVGQLSLKKINKLLKEFDVKVIVRGSTAFKVSGKGDVEIGVYPRAGDWKKIITTLTHFFGRPESKEKNYVRFNFLSKKTEVEIIVLKGREGYVDLKLHEYLLSHPTLLKEYESVKIKYAYSKREYNFRKNEFLRMVEKMIPED